MGFQHQGWPRTFASRVAGVISASLARVWTHDRAFYVALTAFNMFLARRTFGGGIWADNDSVCHYAYVRHLLEDFYPATGTFIGWTPKYDLGAPFLLYNTPPGLYVAAAVVSKLTTVSALAALKAVVTVAFLSVPILGAMFSRTLEDRPGDLPKFVALTLSLFSSELFGLEFYFKNGMLNPAVALPFAIGTLLFFRRAQQTDGRAALRCIALAAVAFAATTFTHLLTAYMLALALGCFTFAQGRRQFGRSVVQVALLMGLGSGLVAFWLVPSLTFAAKEDAAYSWIRRPLDTIGDLFEGSLLSSYSVGFYPHFVTYSAVGIVAVACAGYGLWCLVLQWNSAVAACAGTAAVALLVALGPRPSFGLWILPAYHRLLWYRFVTLFSLMIFLVAAWGAWRLWQTRTRFGSTIVLVLVGGALWAGLVMTQRAVKVQTANSYPGFVADIDTTATWLREHRKRGGRVFSEFLNENVVDAAGVNYARHMVPILSGLSEAGGWVYENDQAAQVMMSRGLFWHNPLPMIALAARYDVEYIVAGSPNFVRALAEDPRWRRILETDHVSLFEAVGREPSSVEASGWNPRVASEGYTPGGGYEYRIELEPDGRVDMSRELLVRTSWSPAWRAHIGDRELRVTPTDDALASVTLPETRAPATLMLTWDIGELRGKGNRLSLAALIVTLVLLALVALPKLAWLDIVPADLPRWGGVVLAAVAVALAASRGRPIDENVVGFGIRGGMAVTFDSKRVEVGAFDDAEDVRLVRVLERAWGPRALLRGAPARTLAGNEASAAVVTLSPVGPNRLTVRGLALEKSGNERSDAPISMVLRDSGTAETLCRLDTRLGIPTLIPGECVTGPTSQGPGTSRQLALVAEGGLVVSGIDLDNGIALVEAETMHNVLDDGGYDAFYALGRPDEFASNGVSMRARSGYERPIALDRVVALPSAAYDVWVLMRTVSPRLHNGQGHLLIQADGVDLADVDPRPRNVVPFWESDSHLEWLPAGRVQGGTTRRIRVTCHRLETAFDGLCDLDAIAFVPAS